MNLAFNQLFTAIHSDGRGMVQSDTEHCYCGMSAGQRAYWRAADVMNLKSSGNRGIARGPRAGTGHGCRTTKFETATVDGASPENSGPEVTPGAGC
jgi:hypothetical protein